LITGNKGKKDRGICLSGMKLRTLGRAIGSEPLVLNLEDGRGSKQVTGGLLISKKNRDGYCIIPLTRRKIYYGDHDMKDKPAIQDVKEEKFW